jgi:large subunit ribosomal protein L25
MAIELSAQSRRTMGKKVRFVRREGVIPANLYSRGADSLPIQLDGAEIQKILAQHGSGGLITLKLTGEKHPRNVVVREVQRDALTDGLIHVDFQQVSLTEEIKVLVRIAMTGEAKLPKSSNAVVIQTMNSIALRGLPKHIPEKIIVDISSLNDAGQTIRVKDLGLDKDVTVMADPDEIIVKVVASRIEVEVVAEKPAAATAEAAEGAEAKEGAATPAPEGKGEKPKSAKAA